jgi:hypothetical protein
LPPTRPRARADRDAAAAHIALDDAVDLYVARARDIAGNVRAFADD